MLAQYSEDVFLKLKALLFSLTKLRPCCGDDVHDQNVYLRAIYNLLSEDGAVVARQAGKYKNVDVLIEEWEGMNDLYIATLALCVFVTLFATLISGWKAAWHTTGHANWQELPVPHSLGRRPVAAKNSKGGSSPMLV